VTAEIAAAAAACGRDPGTVRLTAVSKTHDAAAIRPILEAGHRCFGENRVQEAQDKWPRLRADFPDVDLHLIGPLQTNKIAAALDLFDVIETIDRPRLATALATAMVRSGRQPRCFVQVNIGSEPQKAGIAPEEADRFIAFCRTEAGLPISGLMCIPPVDADPAPYFTRLAALAARQGLSELSMGMTGDFRQAIAAGATRLRVGTAIFGARPPIAPTNG
jgi:pyridoxal phosphate enzyme (YggS family)